MKTITYRGRLAMGTQDELNLKTNNGKTGYRIIKFQTISAEVGLNDLQTVTKIFNKTQAGSIGPAVDFTDSELLAVNYYHQGNVPDDNVDQTIIFDKQVFNQNIFITSDDARSATIEMNYYIELEAFPISDLQATQLTLSNIRTVKSS